MLLLPLLRPLLLRLPLLAPPPLLLRLPLLPPLPPLLRWPTRPRKSPAPLQRVLLKAPRMQ